MALPQAYAQYNNSKILTASPAELTLMLYDGAIKFCNIAIMGIEQGNIQKAHDNIMKVQRIIEEFFYKRSLLIPVNTGSGVDISFFTSVVSFKIASSKAVSSVSSFTSSIKTSCFFIQVYISTKFYK